MIEAPSPNFDARDLPVSMIVLHYTGMETGEAAIARLRDTEAKVSSHYVVAEDGIVLRLVDEADRAWHAGKSSWRGITDVNSASVGIEIVNPGHAFGYRPFPDAQIRSEEEHTSELQSLMRISYAVFCLKKKPTRHEANK